MDISKVAVHPRQAHHVVRVSELDTGEVKAREVEAGEVLGSADPRIVLRGCERLEFRGTEHGKVVHTTFKTPGWSSSDARSVRHLPHGDGARVGTITSGSRHRLTRACCWNRGLGRPSSLGLGTCLSANLGDGFISELVAGSEVVDELVLSGKGFVAVAEVAVVVRPVLCCDMAVETAQPPEGDTAVAQESLVAFFSGMPLQGVVVQACRLAGGTGVGRIAVDAGVIMRIMVADQKVSKKKNWLLTLWILRPRWPGESGWVVDAPVCRP